MGLSLFLNKFLKQFHQHTGRKVYHPTPDYIRVGYCFIAAYLTCGNFLYF